MTFKTPQIIKQLAGAALGMGIALTLFYAYTFAKPLVTGYVFGQASQPGITSIVPEAGQQEAIVEAAAYQEELSALEQLQAFADAQEGENLPDPEEATLDDAETVEDDMLVLELTAPEGSTPMPQQETTLHSASGRTQPQTSLPQSGPALGVALLGSTLGSWMLRKKRS